MTIDWQTEREQKFPQDLRSASQAAERTTKVPSCLTMAQWAWESAWGSKVTGSNNYFGMKWWEGCGFPFHEVLTHEFVNGERIATTAKFIAFPTLEAACLFHGQRLANPEGPYAPAHQYLGTEWRKFVQTVCPIYATDPAYQEAILNLIDTYHLADWNLPEYADESPLA